MNILKLWYNIGYMGKGPESSFRRKPRARRALAAVGVLLAAGELMACTPGKVTSSTARPALSQTQTYIMDTAQALARSVLHSKKLDITTIESYTLGPHDLDVRLNCAEKNTGKVVIFDVSLGVKNKAIANESEQGKELKELQALPQNQLPVDGVQEDNGDFDPNDQTAVLHDTASALFAPGTSDPGEIKTSTDWRALQFPTQGQPVNTEKGFNYNNLSVAHQIGGTMLKNFEAIVPGTCIYA